jgi:nucleoside-diphosphate-sugar epimerase
MSESSQKILVTGGAGYIGSVLTRALLDRGHRVTVLDNFLFGQTSLLDCCPSPNFSIVRGDCRDERILADLLPTQDVVIPLAALVGAPMCDFDRSAATTTNLGAVQSIVKLMAASQRILYPVTNSGYGIGAKGVECTEDSPLKPISLYGETKVAAEQAVLDRGNAITFRLATVFGASPRMRVDLLVNDFVYRAMYDRAVVLFEAHFKRNYIHVRDVAKVFVHGLDRFEAMKGRPYNVGLDSANLSKKELCEAIRKHIPGFVFFEAPIGRDPDQRDYIVSNARILSAGYAPDWTLDAGIQELMKAYRIVRRTEHANF